jgi:hypothetical protein
MFRFTIRELVLLTLVVALSVGWWIDHFRSSDAIARLKIDNDKQRADAESAQLRAEEALRVLTHTVNTLEGQP